MELPTISSYGGGYHGLNQVLGKLLQPAKDACRKVLHIGDTSLVRKVWDIALTFCLIAYGWMLFYAPDMQFIVDVTKGYLHLGAPYIHQTTVFFFAIGFALLLVKDFKDEFFAEKIATFREKHKKFSIGWNYVKYAALAILIVWIGVLGGGQFIYFKF